jgi:hypothetical protein
MRTINFLFIFLASCFAIACTNIQDNDPYPKFSLPLLSDPLEVKTYWEWDIYGKTTSYLIQKNKSPETIFNFYKKNFEQYSFWVNSKAVFPTIISKDAEYFADGEWQKPPAQYSMGWINKDQTMVVKVTIAYNKHQKTRVTCFLHPYSDISELIKFEKELQDQSQVIYMWEVIGKYKKENGNFDLEEARKKEPKSELLTSIIELVEKDTQLLRDNYLEYTKNL